MRDTTATNMTEATAAMPEATVHGDPGAWECLGKFANAAVMKSTKLLDLGAHGCVLQVTTREEVDGTVAVAEAIQFLPGVPAQSIRDKFAAK